MSSPATSRTRWRRSGSSIRRTRRRCGSRSSAGTSPSAPAGRARSSTGRPSSTCWASRRCCPTGEIVETGGKVVKNVVGYDLTHLLVGSEGTLAIITKIILRLVPKPPVQATLRATFRSVEAAVSAVGRDHPRARRAGGHRAHRRHLARGGRPESQGALARAGGHGGHPARRSRRRAGVGGRRGDPRRARAPGGGRDRSAARARRCRAAGALARAPGAVALAQDGRRT